MLPERFRTRFDSSNTAVDDCLTNSQPLECYPLVNLNFIFLIVSPKMIILNFLAMLLNPLKKYEIFVNEVVLLGWGKI